MRGGGPATARKRQAIALVDGLRRAASSPTEPTVVGGDFNTSWGFDEPAVKVLRDTFPDAVPPRVRVTWAGPLGTGALLDHLVARTGGKPIQVRRIDERFGSDHFPLLALIDLGAI
jgi:endonuclease/exonuclease/phosphatase (EEP) superfamily protein YafD